MLFEDILDEKQYIPFMTIILIMAFDIDEFNGQFFRGADIDYYFAAMRCARLLSLYARPPIFRAFF